MNEDNMNEDNIGMLLQARDSASRIKGIQSACKDKRTDLLPELIELLGSEEVGYFVEECLSSFGEDIIPLLQTVLHDSSSSEIARERTASVLAYFGSQDAIPFLLKAIEKPNVNQYYFNHLTQLAPDALGASAETILNKNIDIALSTTEDLLADYFAKLILVIKDLNRQQHISQTLESLLQYGHHWLIQAASAKALYPINPTYYRKMITQLAEHDNREAFMKLLQRLTAG